MRLLLVAVSSNTQLSGVTRHAANVARCLVLNSRIEAVDVIAAPWECQMLRAAIGFEDPRLHIHSVDPGRHNVARNLWYFFDLPEIAAQLEADVVHYSYPAPLNWRKMRSPVIVTVHDLYPWDIPENFGFPRVLFNRVVQRQCERAADALACVSDATLERLRKWEPASVAARATRIYNSLEPVRGRMGRSPVEQCRSVPFLLCVAQHRRNKNIDLALRTLGRLLRAKAVHPEMMLLVVGIPGPETESLRRRIRSEEIGQHVVLLSGIPEPELQWCYRNCEALLAPSLTEGFGLPVAEGLLAGCRIVCSDIPPFRELGGEHCNYLALGENEEEAFAAAIRSALRQPRKGPVALSQISGETIAGEYMALYRRLLKGSGRSERTAEMNEDRLQAAGAD